jgi:hypothetical protein
MVGSRVYTVATKMYLRRCTIAIRLAALALVMAAAACAASSQPPVVARTTVAATPVEGFDGTYRGESSPDQIVEGCGETPHDITIKVMGDRAWVHHGHPSLSGAIDATGQISLQNDDGTNSLSGSIQSGILTATETTSSAPRKLQGFYVGSGATCTFAIQASRHSGNESD